MGASYLTIPTLLLSVFHLIFSTLICIPLMPYLHTLHLDSVSTAASLRLNREVNKMAQAASLWGSRASSSTGANSGRRQALASSPMTRHYQGTDSNPCPRPLCLRLLGVELVPSDSRCQVLLDQTRLPPGFLLQLNSRHIEILSISLHVYFKTGPLAVTRVVLELSVQPNLSISELPSFSILPMLGSQTP